MSRFPDTHPIDLVHGLKKPGKASVLKMMANRAAYLTKALDRQINKEGWEAVQRQGWWELSELLAIARIVEWLEEWDKLPEKEKERRAALRNAEET